VGGDSEPVYRRRSSRRKTGGGGRQAADDARKGRIKSAKEGLRPQNKGCVRKRIGGAEVLTSREDRGDVELVGVRSITLEPGAKPQ
jgi:hypothetical protein